MSKIRLFDQEQRPRSPTVIYIKGLKNFYGYHLMDKPSEPVLSYSEFGKNLSELEALVKALSSVRYPRNTILVRSNLEWLKKIILGEYTPNDSNALYLQYKEISKDLNIVPQWVPKNERSKKQPDILNMIELSDAQRILDALEQQCQENKLNLISKPR